MVAKHWTQLKWLSMHAQFIDAETETQAAVSNHHNFMAQESRDGVWTHPVWFQSQLSQILHCNVSQDVWLIPWFPILATGQVSYLIQFSSVAQSCPTLWDPTNRSMPGLPVYHQLPEFTQTHVHRVGDAIQPSHPLSSPSPPAPNPSQHQGLFQWVTSLELSKTVAPWDYLDLG